MIILVSPPEIPELSEKVLKDVKDKLGMNKENKQVVEEKHSGKEKKSSK